MRSIILIAVQLEAILLTGGASRRMGEDKASLIIEGVPQARRIADSLLAMGMPVTILGREPLEGCELLLDSEEFGGPLAAIAAFVPRAEWVFVASCDLPLFDARLVASLLERIGTHDAAVPEVNGWRQPLCALYARRAWDRLPEASCAMRWLDALDHVVLRENDLSELGIAPLSAQGANTKAELHELLEGS